MFVFMGCRKTMVTHNVNPFDAEIFHNRTIGASANELLDDDVYKSLVVEVQFMPGYRPQQGTLDHLRTFLETYLNKPKGISIVLRQIGSVEKDSLSMEDASVVEKNNRRRFASPAKAAIYILFTDGLHPGNKILGMAYRNTSVVIYGRSVRKYSSMKSTVAIVFFILSTLTSFSQKLTVQSPNQKITASIFCHQNSDIGEWYIKAVYNNNGKTTDAIPRVNLGLARSDQDFSKELKFLKASKPFLINEQYAALHGKRSVCSNTGNEVIVSFENPSKAKLNIIIRAYNDGIAFRYEFPER